MSRYELKSILDTWITILELRLDTISSSTAPKMESDIKLLDHIFLKTIFFFLPTSTELQIETTTQDQPDFYLKESQDMVTIIQTMLSAGM